MIWSVRSDFIAILVIFAGLYLIFEGVIAGETEDERDQGLIFSVNCSGLSAHDSRVSIQQSERQFGEDASTAQSHLYRNILANKTVLLLRWLSAGDMHPIRSASRIPAVHLGYRD